MVADLLRGFVQEDQDAALDFQGMVETGPAAG